MAKKAGTTLLTIKNLLLVIGAAAVVTVGMVIWRLNASQTSDLTIVFTAIEHDISANVGDYKSDIQPWLAENISDQKVSVDGYDYRISSSALPFMQIQPVTPQYATFAGSAPVTSISTVRGHISSVLLGKGFSASKTTETMNAMSATTQYARGDETCTLDEAGSTYILTLSCNSPEFPKQVAAEGKPFVKEYLTHHTNLRGADLTFGPLTIKSQHPSGVIKPSKNAGYDIAEAMINEPRGLRIALYYQKQGGPWHYVTDTTDEFGFNCQDMRSNPDARKALYAQVCYERPDGGPRLLDSAGRATQ
jgi:hypothetical protein